MPPRAWLTLKWIVITIHYSHQHLLLIMLSPPRAVSEGSPWEESQKQDRAHEAGWVSAVCGMNVPLCSDMHGMTSPLLTLGTGRLTDKLKAISEHGLFIAVPPTSLILLGK